MIERTRGDRCCLSPFKFAPALFSILHCTPFNRDLALDFEAVAVAVQDVDFIPPLMAFRRDEFVKGVFDEIVAAYAARPDLACRYGVGIVLVAEHAYCFVAVFSGLYRVSFPDRR